MKLKGYMYKHNTDTLHMNSQVSHLKDDMRIWNVSQMSEMSGW